MPRLRTAGTIVAGLVLASTGLRLWAARQIPGPWITPDETIYALLGSGLYRAGHLAILGGPTPFYSLVEPIVIGPWLSFGDLELGHRVLQGIQPFLMSLAAVPVYLWGRSLMPRRLAVVAAALTLAVPGLAYSGLVMTEVVFYPVFVLAAWAMAKALERPSPTNQALAAGAVVLATATRLQAIVLLPAFATALLVDAALARSPERLRRLAPAVGTLTIVAIAWLSWRLASGRPLLGGYALVSHTSYDVSAAARYVLYHAASLLVLTGVFPLCALLVLLIRGLAGGERSPAARAYLAVAFSLSFWLVLEVGVFASRHVQRIEERDLLGLAPVLFIALALWLARGAPRPFVLTAGVALAAAAPLLALPVTKYVNVFGTQDAFTLIPFYDLVKNSSPRTLQIVFYSAAGVLVLFFALLPRRLLAGIPLLLIASFAAASVAVSTYVADQAKAQQVRFLGPDPRWVDHAASGPAAYLYDGEPNWPGVWTTLFWNRRIERLYDLPDVAVPGPVPQRQVGVTPGGLFTGAPQVPYVVASRNLVFVGTQAARIDQVGIEQAGLGLWRVERPLRLLSRTTGVQANGDIFATGQGRVTAYGCRRGVFALTLLVKEAETIEIRLNGRPYRRLNFSAGPPPEGGVWRGTVPTPPDANGHGICTLDLVPSGLLGTTVFQYQPG